MKPFLKHMIIWMFVINPMIAIFRYYNLDMTWAVNIAAIYGFLYSRFYEFLTGPWRKK